MHNYISIRRQVEWERKKHNFWKFVWNLTVFFFATTGFIWWVFFFVDRYGKP